jgi:hypothetical protein
MNGNKRKRRWYKNRAGNEFILILNLLHPGGSGDYNSAVRIKHILTTYSSFKIVM